MNNYKCIVKKDNVYCRNDKYVIQKLKEVKQKLNSQDYNFYLLQNGELIETSFDKLSNDTKIYIYDPTNDKPIAELYLRYIISSSIELPLLPYTEKCETRNIEFTGNDFELSGIMSLPRLKDIPYTISLKQHNMRYAYVPNQEPSFGGYGAVVKYSTSNLYSIAVKFGDIDDDINILKKLQESNCLKFIIETRVVRHKHTYKGKRYDNILIMNGADGTLNELPKTIRHDQETLLKILKTITYYFLNLFKCKLYYIDIKPANILYKCIDDNNFIIKLGDIGSITDGKTTKYENRLPYVAVATYPSRGTRNRGYLADIGEYDMVYGVGIIACLLLDINMVAYQFNQPYEDRSDQPYNPNLADKRYIQNLFKNVNVDGKFINLVVDIFTLQIMTLQQLMGKLEDLLKPQLILK